MPATKVMKTAQDHIAGLDRSINVTDQCTPISTMASRNTQAFHLLPTEIIRKIGTFADADTLHALTAVCHFLANCITPLYVERQGLQIPKSDDRYPSIFASTPAHMLALQVWRRSYLFAPLQHLTVVLHHRDADKRAQSLCNLFDSLQDVIFTNRLTIHIDPRSQATALAVLKRVAGCKVLAVRELNSPWYDPHPPPVTGDFAIFATPRTGIYHAPSIDSFESSSNILFTDPFLPWTIPLLHMKLTSLHLHDTSLSHDHWAQLLERINIPLLRNVSISADVEPSPLTSFLRRHSNLVSLRFGQTSKYIRLGTLCLLHLRELQGPPPILKSLMDAFEPSVNISDLSIDTHPVERETPDTLRDILVHPACSYVLRLKIRFAESQDTFVLKDLHLSQSQVQDLTITEGNDGFTFTETALVISSLPALN
jgi:hypothetical protein